ncbi:phage holin family protein [Leucobacter sp. UT-8R-CII-1-4]|uniref:phage holin family protein n=1 Tax=Leucobacter sp. UT-8R-CII-1-4 TaxID=3040075 RepID=UPI0024A7A686|nr:phage holin family protein [Leucobacter sp. UT-8R-CII-1-4]MDI6023510.1 phage holin family protein [Leucobacter sp. UT-8R-CII-1-4]
MRTLIRVLVSAFALWLTTLIVGGSGDHGVWVKPLGTGPYDHLFTLLLIAAVFGLVNGTLGKIVRVVSIPLYIITLGLFGLIVNGFLLLVVAWLSDLAGFGLQIDGFWWGVLAALVLSLLSSMLNGLLGTNKKRDSK